MKIVCCQLDIVWEDKAANYARVQALIERAAPDEGSLVVLPEMFATGFSMNVEVISDSGSRETAMFLAAMASKYKVHMIGGVVTTAPEGRGRNEAAVFAPSGAEVARYCKIHPFSFGEESNHYVGGARIALFDWGEWAVAPFICYDLRFPEVFRAAVRHTDGHAGAQLFTVIANWPAVREEHWITLLKARAIENQAYVAGVNRCGSGGKLAYSGRSLIIDPRGQVLADAGGEEGTITADLDLPALLAYRREFPALNDMRPEYAG